MLRRKTFAVWLVLLSCAGGVLARAEESRRLPLRDYRDKMKAAWLGQMIGVGWGQPTEFKVKGEIIPDERMPPWNPEMVNQHGNDDCYVEMTFMRTLEQYGFDVSIRQAGIDFANSGYQLWHANKAGRDNLRSGIAPPDSGHPKFNTHADDIDYQIEADFSGIISPGLPNQVIDLGQKFGRLMNYGDGVYAGQFIGGMYAEAYFESDPAKLVAAGLKCVPAESQYAEMVQDVSQWCKENDDWQKTWQLVEDKYHKDPKYTHRLCSGPGGKGAFSIDVKLNGAYVIMGLLYGKGDPDRTMRIACRCGQDSDCNPANAGGVFFAGLGASKIPARFTEKLDLTRKYSYSEYTVPMVYDVAEKLARAAVLRAGGKIEKDGQGEEVFVIPMQTPKPGKAEQCSAPGPAADAKFTADEMKQIAPQQKKEKKAVVLSAAVAASAAEPGGSPQKDDASVGRASVPAIEGLDLRMQIHDMPVVKHAGVYLGMVGLFDVVASKQWCELAWSPDSIRWHRIQPGRPLIPNGPVMGDCDWGCIFASAPIIRKDGILMYYGASDGRFMGWRSGYLCLAHLRADGFAGYEQIAGGSNKTGSVETKAVVVVGNTLCVSADVAPSGYVKVAALDNRGKSLAEGEPVTTTVTDAPIQWKDGFSLKKEQQVKLRFELLEAKLFSFSFKG